MKVNSLLSRITLLTLLPVASALAEDCSTSFYCYGESQGFGAIRVVVADEAGRAATADNLNPQQRREAAEAAAAARAAANPTPAIPNTPSTRPINPQTRVGGAVPNRPATIPLRANATVGSCKTSHQTLLDKASALDALARTQAAKGKDDQAKRLFNTAAQLRSTATQMACH